MFMKTKVNLWDFILKSPEGEGGSGGNAGGGGETPAPAEGGEGGTSPESVLFPDEKRKEEEGGDGGDKKPDDNADDQGAGDKGDSDKNDDDKGEGDKKKDGEDDPASIVPDDGKYSLTMPEGVQVDQELLDALGPKFAAKKMTNGEAQELADEFIKIQGEREKKRLEDWGNTINGWVDTAKKDPEIGGDKWDDTVRDAQRFADVMGTPALKEYLNASGGGNHPEVIRVFAKAASLIKEDEPPNDNGGGTGRPANAAHTLFPNDAPKG
jgi:hypothetical protein